MAESLGSVLLSLGVDLEDFNAGLNQAQKLASTAGKNISDRLDARRATLSALQSQLTALESKLRSNPWSAAALEAPIKALQAEIELRKQSIALLEKQVQVTKTASTASRSAAASGFLGGAAEALPGIGGALARIGPGAGAAAAGAGVAAAGAAAIKTSNDFQKLNQQLTLLTGSAEATDKALSELKAYAAATPFDLPGVAENAKLLIAFGLNAEQAVEFTKRLGDVATITGTPLDRLALNLGQIISLGKAYTVDLRQFAIAGVPIFEALSQATGKTVAELKQLDAIPAEQVVAAFRIMTDAGGKFFEGGIKGGTQLDTKIASLGDSLKNVGVIIGKEITPVAVGFLKSTIDAVDNLRDALVLLEQLRGKLPGGNSPDAAGTRAASAVFTSPGFSLLKAGLNNLKYELGLFANQPEPQTGAQANAEVQLRAREKIRERDAKAAKDALLAAKEREVAEANIVAPAQRRLDTVIQLRGVEGSALEILKAQAAVQDQIIEQKKLQDAFDKAKQDAGGNANNPAVIDAATKLKAAGIDVQTALIQGSQTAASALQSAADKFKSAGESLRSSLEGAFKFLTPQIQKQLTDNARKDIQAAQKAGIFRGDVVGLNTTPEELLSIGGSARGVLAATKTFDAAGKDLVGALNAVQSPLISLAEKDWQVVVNVASDGLAAVSGDVLGGVA